MHFHNTMEMKVILYSIRITNKEDASIVRKKYLKLKGIYKVKNK